MPTPQSTPVPTSSPTPAPTPVPTTPTAAPPTPAPTPKVSHREWEQFTLVNHLREKGHTCGATSFGPAVALEFDCRLWKAAQLHSADMAAQDYFSHTSKDGRSPWDRAMAQGLSANGENIAAGSSTASGVLDQWKGSTGHCKNMMNPGFKMFAVGHSHEKTSTFGHYWTQMFRSSLVEADTSCYPVEVLVETGGDVASSMAEPRASGRSVAMEDKPESEGEYAEGPIGTAWSSEGDDGEEASEDAEGPASMTQSGEGNDGEDAEED